MFLSFREYLYLRNLDFIVVRCPQSVVPEQALLNEGRWVESSKNGWSLRVDAADPAIPLQRHVHVSRTKHTSSKNQQASWNQDGSRHDRKSFNTGVGSTAVARELAKAALGLADDVVLEHAVQRANPLTESNGDVAPGPSPRSMCFVAGKI